MDRHPFFASTFIYLNCIILFLLSGCGGVSTIKYEYDSLGRLTFVEDSANGKRDYDYDPAGNRTLVANNTTTDEQTEPAGIGSPTGLSQSPTGDCAWKATWDSVTNAHHYEVRDIKGGVQTVTSNIAYVSCARGNPSENKARQVSACDALGKCSFPANF
ncbi:MAG TPA: RHS repeat domain-containing protein [Cellvibrionaceae bacterium]